MVTYGPWIQDPDFVSVVPVPPANNFDNVIATGAPYAHYFSVEATGPDWYSEDVAGAVRTAVLSMLASRDGWAIADPSTDPSPATASLGWQTYNIQGTINEKRTDAAAQGYTETWVVTPPRFSRYPPGGGALDESAIGFEWQDSPGPLLWADGVSGSSYLRPTWAEAALDPTTLLYAETYDDYGTGDGPLSNSWTGEIEVGPWGAGEIVWSSSLGPDYRGGLEFPMGGDSVDLTSWVATEGHAELHAFSPSVLAATEPLAYTTQWSYTLTFHMLQVAWTLRPPVYRWIYDDSEPYRRIFPRDDALGAGSARNYPRPKGRSSSNRTSGGYL